MHILVTRRKCKWPMDPERNIEITSAGQDTAGDLLQCSQTGALVASAMNTRINPLARDREPGRPRTSVLEENASLK